MASAPATVPAVGRLRQRMRGQEGFGLVEVLVSALLVALVSIGVFAGLDAASATSGDIKNRAIAAGLAQQDIERMRGLRVQDLSNLRETNTKVICDDQNQGCTTYTVVSRADWVSDQSGTQSCTSSSTRADYLDVSTSVTWPGMGGLKPVTSDSLVAPPNGSFGPNQGTLAVQIVGDDGVTGVPGIPVSLTGPATYNDVTNSQGCVVWGYLPAGSGYTVAFSQPGYVDKEGTQAVSKSVSVVGDSVTTQSFLYAPSGSARLTFYAQVGAIKYASQQADSVTFVQSQMAASKTFPPTAALATSISASPLFPFNTTSPGGQYRVYAGNCSGEDPNLQTPPDSTNLDFLNLQPGNVNKDVTDANSPSGFGIRLPAFNGLMRINASNVVAGNNAKVKIVQTTTSGCGAPPLWSSAVSAAVSTSGANIGRLPATAFPGRPYGVYNVCAEADSGGVHYRQYWKNIALNATSVALTTPGQAAGIISIDTVSPFPANQQSGAANTCAAALP